MQLHIAKLEAMILNREKKGRTFIAKPTTGIQWQEQVPQYNANNTPPGVSFVQAEDGRKLESDSETDGKIIPLSGGLQAVIEYDDLDANGERVVRFVSITQPWFWAEITGSGAYAANRWIYSFKEKELTQFGWQDKANGLVVGLGSNSALNSGEANHDSSHAQNAGFNPETSYSQVFVQPVYTGLVVQMYKLQMLVNNTMQDTYRFYAPNWTSATCQAQL